MRPVVAVVAGASEPTYARGAKSVTDLRRGELLPPSASVGVEPLLDLRRVEREIEEQHLDLHDIAHRIAGNADVAAEASLKRSLEVERQPPNQEGDVLQARLSLEA